MVNVSCPNCQATYQLDASKLADGGRKLKCAQCGTVWVARAPEPETAAPAEQPTAAPATESSSQPTPETPVEPAPDTETPAESPQESTAEPAAEQATLEEQDDLPPPEHLIQRTPGLDDLTKVGGWSNFVRGDNIWRTIAIIFAAVGFLIGAGLLWSHFSASAPETEETQQTAEIPPPAEESTIIPPPPGVVLHRVRGEVSKVEGEEGGVSLTVRGLLANTTSETVVIPPMRLELLGTSNTVADMWPVTDISNTLLPGSEQAWSVSMSAPDMEAIKGWRIVFVNH